MTGSKTQVQSPFNFMIPQVLVFVFLLLGSVVSIWRDLDNSQLSLATAWNVTNTFILGAFIVVAFKESWRNRHPRPAVVGTELANHLDDEIQPRTKVIVPPALESSLGVRSATSLVAEVLDPAHPRRRRVRGAAAEGDVLGPQPDLAARPAAPPARRRSRAARC